MNKHIEKMAKVLCGLDRECEHCTASMSYICKAKKYAERAYTAGYRKQEWISVEERLPETREAYIVCRFDGYVYKTFFSGTFPKTITHWMPLPMPPKGDEGE